MSQRRIEVRDIRNGEWAWVYNSLLRDPHLNPVQKVIYGTLASFGGHAECRPGISTIAELAGVKARTVQRAIVRLVEVGYIAIEHGTGRGHSNTYLLLRRPKGCLCCHPLFEERATVQTPFRAERVSPETRKGDSRVQKRVSPETPHKEIEQKEERQPPVPQAPWLETVFRHYCAVMDRNPNLYTLTPQRREMLRCRLVELWNMAKHSRPELSTAGWMQKAVELAKACIDACAQSDWHMGRDAKTGGKKYNDLGNIFRSREQMEKWLNV